MRATVGIVNCQTYDLEQVRGAVDRLVQSIGGWESFIKSGDTVLIKPNMIGPKKPDVAATTHPSLVQAISERLQELGCTVWIGDSAGGAIGGVAPTAQALKVCGYQEAAKASGAEVKNFDASGSKQVQSKVISFAESYHLAAPVFEADLVINLPKLKTHSAAIYTGALKNLFGLVPGLAKAEFHRQAPTMEEFAEAIVDINLNTPISLNIMDAIVGMEGAGPTAGNPKQVGLMLASSDRVALDAVACRLIGLDPLAVPIVNLASQHGLGTLNEIKFAGDYDYQPKISGYKLPPGLKVNPKLARFFLNAVVKAFKTRPQVDLETCRQCNICVENCPVQVIDAQSKAIDYSACIECLCCHELCPHHAVELVRQNPLIRYLQPLFGRFHK